MSYLFERFSTIDENLSYGFQEYGDEYTPNFTLMSNNLPIGKDIESFALAEKCHYVVNSKGKIFRKKYSTEDNYKAINEVEASKLFIDLAGYHCIVVTNNEKYYISLLKEQMNTLKLISNLRITAIAFPEDTSEKSTGDILLGCSDGNIYLYKIEFDKSLEIKEATPKKVFHISSGDCIKGMVYKVYSNKKESSALVVITTKDTCYQFTGHLPFTKLFNSHKAHDDANLSKIIKGEGDGEMKIFSFHKEKEGFKLRAFAWKARGELIYGNFRNKKETIKPPIIKDIKSYNYNEDPISIAITEHNLYFLYKHHLEIISKITNKTEHTEKFKDESMKDICYDIKTNSLWISSDKGVYELKVGVKDEDMWQQYLENKEYDKAIYICKGSNKKYLGYINGVYADVKHKEGKFTEAAQLYVLSDKTFEEVMFKYLMEDNTEGMLSNCF